MVSELAPLIMSLRYIVTKGDMLIIEKPEAHLHPTMQVEITRQIASLVKSGIQVLITTHSEWIIEELSNIVNKSRISSKIQKKSSNDELVLNPEDVGVWLFVPKQRPKGTVVREVPLDYETGLYCDGFDEIAITLQNEWADIADKIDAN